MYALDQTIDLFFSVVKSERGSRRGRHIKSFHDRLRAMMPRAHRDALPIEDGSHVMRMNIV